MFSYQFGGRGDRRATMQGKHANMLRPTPERAIVGSLDTTRDPGRDRVMVRRSIKAGLGAKAIASLQRDGM
jgi:hypothetical protein